MRIWLFMIALVFPGLLGAQQEHFILCGGPAVRSMEDLRVERDRHDRFWGNFVRASTIRMDQLRRAYGKDAKIVWVVYRDGYVSRGREDGKPYVTWIQEQATKRNATLIWISSGDEAIRAINARPSRSIVTFDFFGHSNRHCLMLDYGSEVMAVSKAWIHEKDLPKIRSSVFNKNALCQSYGCHTGESMSQVWRRHVGNTLIGAHGKTDYATISYGKLPSVSGSWVR